MDIKEDRVSISSLLLSIILGGFCAITKRGFGSFKINSLKLINELSEYENLALKIYKEKNPDIIEETIKKFINKSLNDSEEYLRIKKEIKQPTIPSISSLIYFNERPSPFNLKIIQIDLKEISKKEKEIYDIFHFKHFPMKLLTKLGYSTTKILWKIFSIEKWKEKRKEQYSLKNLSPKCNGFGFHTWILGLPRYQKYKEESKEIITGYKYDNKEERRSSSISLKPINNLNDKQWIIAIYGFLSLDWRKTLYHYGIIKKREKGKIIKKEIKRKINCHENIDQVFYEGWNNIIRILIS